MRGTSLEPGAMSITREVPSAVPSLRQSSQSATPPFPAKRGPSTLVSHSGEPPSAPGLMSCTMKVPFSLPSLLRS